MNTAETRLSPGHQLHAGNWIQSANGQAMLLMQADGNLVLYRVAGWTPLWASYTSGQGLYVEMQVDGNLVMYDSQRHARWATGTSGYSNSYLALQDDGNMVVYAAYAGGRWVRWSTSTGGRLTVSSPTALAPNRISWSDFSGCTESGDQQLCGIHVLADGDSIQLTQTGPLSTLNPWDVQVNFTLGANVTWLKTIRAFAYDGSVVDQRTLDNQHGPVSMTIDTRRVAALVFIKAKFLGVPTPEYDLRSLSIMDAHVVNFSWQKD